MSTLVFVCEVVVAEGVVVPVEEDVSLIVMAEALRTVGGKYPALLIMVFTDF